MNNSEKSKKCIWIISQEADHRDTGPHNRHFELAYQLMKKGYQPIVFASSATRQSGIQVISGKEKFLVNETYGFPFVFVKTPQYKNMKERLLAIFLFHKRLIRIVKNFPSPNVIIGSSAYPLSPYLGIRFAKKLSSKTICEVRDLWPLSLEEYGIIPKGGSTSKAMYRLERYLYEHSDDIVFTFSGGKQYICDRKLDYASGGKVDLHKVHYINNGVNLGLFYENKNQFRYANSAFSEFDGKRIVYTGSLRKANKLDMLIDVAKCFDAKDVRFYLFGRGEREQVLKERCLSEKITNIYFMGWVSKKYIPSILEQADIAIEFGEPNSNLMKYGTSPNKLFDYFASGTPVFSNHQNDLSIINQENCGTEQPFDSPEECFEILSASLNDTEKLALWKSNALRAAQKYSFESLANQLIHVIEGD